MAEVCPVQGLLWSLIQLTHSRVTCEPDRQTEIQEYTFHENFGGGFSPPSAHKIRRLGRAAKNGTDRTRLTAAARQSRT